MAWLEFGLLIASGLILFGVKKEMNRMREVIALLTQRVDRATSVTATAVAALNSVVQARRDLAEDTATLTVLADKVDQNTSALAAAAEATA